MLAAAPTYLVTMGSGRWAGEEAAEVTPIVSPDTRLTWAVTTENLENIIINMSGGHTKPTGNFSLFKSI